MPLTTHVNLLNNNDFLTMDNVYDIEAFWLDVVLLLAKQVAHSGEAVPSSCDEGIRASSAWLKFVVRNIDTNQRFIVRYLQISCMSWWSLKTTSLSFDFVFFQMIYVTITHITHPGFLKKFYHCNVRGVTKLHAQLIGQEMEWLPVTCAQSRCPM